MPSRARHGVDPTEPSPADVDVEGHPRHPPKQRQIVARRTVAWLCLAFVLALTALSYSLLQLGLPGAAQPSLQQGSMYGASAAVPTASSGMGRHRFPDPRKSATRHAAAEALAAAQSALAQDGARGPRERARPQGAAGLPDGLKGELPGGVPGGHPGGPQGGAPARQEPQLSPAAVQTKCVEDYSFAYCEQDRRASCARWGDTLCRATCTPGCGSSYEAPSYETAAAALQQPHLETQEVLPHPTGVLSPRAFLPQPPLRPCPVSSSCSSRM
jgi:hypothetical protein